MGSINLLIVVNGAESRLRGAEGVFFAPMPAAVPEPLADCQGHC